MKPILLYNDECAVCRRIGDWVRRSSLNKSGEATIIVRPIGDDPEDLRTLNPSLDIWDAYETIHIVMPGGAMKMGGEAVAVVLQNLPNTQWFAWVFSLQVFGHQPFQTVLNIAYAVLSAIRPLFGCESCGSGNHWMRAAKRASRWLKNLRRKALRVRASPRS